MIEIIKDYLYLSETLPKEFSIVDVRPRLQYKKENVERDYQSLFDSSGKFVVCVRSYEAQKDIRCRLESGDFQDIEEIEDCDLCVGKRKERAGDYLIQSRNYYNDHESLVSEYLYNSSKLGIRVRVEEDRLEDFRRIIQESGYKNIWRLEPGKLIIA